MRLRLKSHQASGEFLVHHSGSILRGSENKWCPEEGDEVVRLLYQLAHAGASSDLYVITPFVIVADGLRLAIRNSGVLRGWVDDEWRRLNERVGTVHTAQGREAEAVIIILSAPNPSQRGALTWAGGQPNILNVAVTRAKEAVYVIGNVVEQTIKKIHHWAQSGDQH